MKIVFVTFHNWETKRIGGFHRLAENAAKLGHEVVFFSFQRPYYIYFKNEERLNKNVLKKLIKGVEYNVEGHKILNITWSTFRLPQPFYKYCPSIINKWLNTHSVINFKRFNERYLSNTDVFVFESSAGEEIFDMIRELNPNSILTYRPSDPRMIDGASLDTVELEKHIITNSDYVFIVNKAGYEIYKRNIEDFDTKVKYSILPNGVDTHKFKQKYDCPELLTKKNTALYVGARVIEWNLIIKAAKCCNDINFIIICPEIPNPKIQSIINSMTNLYYVPGISPDDVPKWVTNCNIYIVPNPTGWYKIKPWGITAKYYQAMAAKKAIVAYEDTDELANYGVFVSHNYDDFINDLKKAIMIKREINYNYNLNDWEVISTIFINKLNSLCLKKLNFQA